MSRRVKTNDIVAFVIGWVLLIIAYAITHIIMGWFW